MKIRNIDVDQEEVKRIACFSDFVLDTINTAFKYEIAKLDKKDLISSEPVSAANISNCPIYKFANIDYCNIANLIHTIPIYLTKEQPNNYIKNNDDREESIEKGTNEDKIDLLGAYFSNQPNGIPHIEIYAHKIKEAVTKENVTNDIEYKWLFTKVLIHELAHAALDIYNWEKFSKTDLMPYSSKFGKWREESTANAVTLMIIKRTNNEEFYSYAKEFMKKQPKEYQLGVLMEDFGYETFMSVMRNKIDGPSNQTDEWLDYVNNNPTPDKLKEWNKKLTK